MNIFDPQLWWNETLKERQRHYQRVQQSLLVQIKFTHIRWGRDAFFEVDDETIFKAFSLMDYIMIITDVSIDQEHTHTF